jgi:hypothetical protein
MTAAPAPSRPGGTTSTKRYSLSLSQTNEASETVGVICFLYNKKYFLTLTVHCFVSIVSFIDNSSICNYYIKILK